MPTRRAIVGRYRMRLAISSWRHGKVRLPQERVRTVHILMYATIGSSNLRYSILLLGTVAYHVSMTMTMSRKYDFLHIGEVIYVHVKRVYKYRALLPSLELRGELSSGLLPRT